MNQEPSFWNTVRLLLVAARMRAMGRRERRQEILNKKAGKPAGRRTSSWGWIGTVVSVFFLSLVHGMAALSLYFVISAAERIDAEHQGKIAVSSWFLEATQTTQSSGWNPPDYASEAKRISEEYGGKRSEIE